ncbi:MAG: preprotein translocase subunit SecY [Bifidobacteriaceae bacterium]|jgi:preprotein translocase subunit SecY|nr:preprotein translocase subunit SecY [Bifidobacteriaceae bacterium]
MFSGLIQAFKTADLRNKIFFTLFIIVLFRIGSFLPTPGVDYNAVAICTKATQSNDMLSLVNIFSGGALLNVSVFALGIMPYITSSIVVQLLRVVVPHFANLHKEGQQGQATLTQYTRYLTIGLAVLQSTTIITTARTGALFGGTCNAAVIPDETIPTLLIMITIMTAGTAMIMFLGEQITAKGVGNGMSILIFSSICSNFLPNLWSIATGSAGFSKFLIVIFAILVIITIICFMENAQRRIPVQYGSKKVGSRTVGGGSSYLPLKINMSGVIPIIFASSFLAAPSLLLQFADQTSPIVQWITANITSQTAVLHLTLYAILIFFFCFLYTSITYDVGEVAENLRNSGGFITGKRAGSATAIYLKYVINRINTVGAIYLTIIAMVPTLLFMAIGVSANLPFGGTTLLIIVGVGLDTVKQINSQLQQHHYDGFLKYHGKV